MTAVDVPTPRTTRTAGVPAPGAARVTAAAPDRPAGHALATDHPIVRLGTGRVESVVLGPFALESGAVLPELVSAYRHDGPGPDRAPQVLVVHALTGSADAAGDWWEPVIGPGRALDTDRFGVICANLLGGRYGTTGPTSVDPRTGLAYGAAFPVITPRDQALAQWALLDALGIARLDLVVGGSLGGMVALEIALARPGAVRTVMPVASPAVIGALAMAWNHVQVELVQRLGSDGLSIARQLAMTTYRSEIDFDVRFGGRYEADGRASVVSYLEHQGRKLVARFDSDTYVALVGAMDRHDIGRGRGGVEAALGALAAAGTAVVGLGIEGDILFGPGQVRTLVDAARRAGVRTVYEEIHSTKGHDAFLVEWDQLGAILQRALSGTVWAP
jgi:homoserine O-acetyltransferase/O-succinyltransferase